MAANRRNDSDSALIIARAECSEKRSTKLEAEVRKLRAESAAMRAQKEVLEMRAKSVELACETGGGLLAARLAADERASKVEEENARLHCEMEALRNALFNGGVSTPHSGKTVASPPSDGTGQRSCARPCARMCSILRCFRRPIPKDQAKLVEVRGRKNHEESETPVEQFQADDV
jgi:hypothetical protein